MENGSEYQMSDARPMCQNCDIQQNREHWQRHDPDMLKLCDMCQDFQDKLFATIATQKKKLNKTIKNVNKAVDRN